MSQATAKAHGRNAFFFVLVTVFIDMMAFGLILPVLPRLIAQLTNSTIAEAATWAGPIAAVYALMNFLAGPLLGNLSDRFGRRPVLLFSIGSLGVDFLIMALAGNIWMLFLGRALAGISGATFSTAQAYIADVTEPENRGGAFGMIGAAFGLGFIIGPVIGGFMSKFGLHAPFYAAAGLSFINFLYGMFVLPESLEKEDRRGFDIKRANPFGAFRHFSKLPQVRWFLVAFFIYSMGHAVYPAIWAYFGEIRFGWTPGDIGLTLGIVGVSTALVQGGLTGRIIRHFGQIKAIWIGLTTAIIAVTAIAFASNTATIYVILIFTGLGGVFGPALQSTMSNLTPRNSQGELRGATASIQSMSMIITPLMMTQTLYAFSVEDAPIYFPGAPFLLAAILLLIAMIPISLGVSKIRSSPAADHVEGQPENDQA